MSRDEIKKIVMQILEESQEDSIGGRDLFWHPLKGVFSTWIYTAGKSPLASVWLDAADGLWYYSIPIHRKTGSEEFRIDAFHVCESKLAGDDTLDRE